MTPPKDKRERLITYNNQTHSIKQWADIVGVKPITLTQRLRLGWPVDQALGFTKRPAQKRPGSPKKLVTYNGQTKTLYEWGDEYNIDPILIYKRLRQNWTPERAITLPLQPKENNTYNVTHGQSGTPLHTLWTRMKGKCYSPSSPGYPTHGAKGITVYDAWLDDYPTFSEYALENGYKDGDYIRLYDPTRNFEPGNIYFTKIRAQRRPLLYDGIQLPLSIWADRRGMSRQKLTNRLSLGWTIGQALGFEPPPKSKRGHPKKKDV